MSNCRLEYPTFVPDQEVVNLVNFALGRDAAMDLACAAQCGWIVLGYGLSYIPHSDQRVTGTRISDSKEDLARAIETKMGLCSGPAGTGAWWSILAPYALALAKKIIQEFLDQLGK